MAPLTLLFRNPILTTIVGYILDDNLNPLSLNISAYFLPKTSISFDTNPDNSFKNLRVTDH